MTPFDFEQEYTARLRVLRHWQCPTCDAWYPTGATCGVCAMEGRDAVPDEPPAVMQAMTRPLTWRDRPALL